MYDVCHHLAAAFGADIVQELTQLKHLSSKGIQDAMVKEQPNCGVISCAGR